MMTRYVIGIDPGGTTGVAVLDAEDGTLMLMYQLNQKEFSRFFVQWFDKPERRDATEAVVFEDFKLFKQRAMQQTGSRFVASQVIGVVKHICDSLGIKCISQEPHRKKMGEKYTQFYPPSDHSQSHYVDAYNHAYYWLVTTKKIPTFADKARANAATREAELRTDSNVESITGQRRGNNATNGTTDSIAESKNREVS